MISNLTRLHELQEEGSVPRVAFDAGISWAEGRELLGYFQWLAKRNAERIAPVFLRRWQARGVSVGPLVTQGDYARFAERMGVSFRKSAARADKLPIVGVSAEEALFYCATLTAETGVLWRLPFVEEEELALSYAEATFEATGVASALWPPLSPEGSEWRLDDPSSPLLNWGVIRETHPFNGKWGSGRLLPTSRTDPLGNPMVFRVVTQAR